MHPLLMVIAWQGYELCRESIERGTTYAAAETAARARNKPLLVVGGPMGGPLAQVIGPRHGPGDVCLDMDPAACTGAAVQHQGDVRRIPFANKVFGAAYCSHVLEHMPTVADCQQALTELRRVADTVFLCVPSKRYVVNWVHPEHHLWVAQRPDGSVEIVQR